MCVPYGNVILNYGVIVVLFAHIWHIKHQNAIINSNIFINYAKIGANYAIRVLNYAIMFANCAIFCVSYAIN